MPDETQDVQAPDMSSVMQGTQPDSSPLNNIVQSQPQMPTYDNSQEKQTEADLDSMPSSPSVGSRLGSILKAVAGSFISNAGAGIAGASNARGRGGFAAGVSAGAQTGLEYKFKTAADAARTAQLTMQDKELHMREQDAQDAHDAHVMQMAEYNKAQNGTTYTYVPNDAASVKANFKAQTANGGISVPAGTLYTTHGFLVPSNDATSQAQANTKNYNTLGRFYGLAPVHGTVTDSGYQVLLNRRNGLDASGKPLPPEDLKGMQASLQSQLDAETAKPNPDTSAVDQIKSDITHLKVMQTSMESGGKSDVDPADVKTFNESVLPGYTNISPAEKNGLKAEALRAKSSGDLDKVQNRALTLEAQGQIHADTEVARNDAKQDAQTNKGLEANEKLLNDPHTGYIGAKAQIDQTRAAITAGADGNSLLTAMLPTMEVLGINHTAGITRISPAEAEAAGQSPEFATRWNAWAQRASTGKLSPEMAKEGNALMDILQQGAHNKLVTQQQILSKGRGIDPSRIPSMDVQGNITTLDKAMSSKQTNPTQNKTVPVGAQPIMRGSQVVGYIQNGQRTNF